MTHNVCLDVKLFDLPGKDRPTRKQMSHKEREIEEKDTQKNKYKLMETKRVPSSVQKGKQKKERKKERIITSHTSLTNFLPY